MPKIVNTNERIKWICEKAYEEFIKLGINNFSLNKFISSLNMSKGQFYHYFKTKEELIYKVMDIKGYQSIENTIKKVSLEEISFNKLLAFFSIYLDDKDDEWKDFNKLIQETLHMYISIENIQIKKMNSDFYNYMFHSLDLIFDEIIEKGDLKEEAKLFPKSIIATADGMFFHSLMNENYNLKDNLYNYLLAIFNLLKKDF